MPKVKMIKSMHGSETGLTTSYYRAGHEYDVSDTLMAAFVEEGAVEMVEQKAVQPNYENKMEAAPENKQRGRPKKVDEDVAESQVD